MNISNKSLPYQIRSAQPSDISFIYSSWLKSYKHGSELGKSTRTGVFFNSYREVLDAILQRSQTFVACLIDEPEVILGYLVHEPLADEPFTVDPIHILHYAFIKESFRRLGIGQMLLEHAKINPKLTYYTHKTILLDKFDGAFSQMTYNPFLLYVKGESL